MTSLIAWVGVDSRGPASFYLASDSRISVPRSQPWDQGPKLFAPRTSPELFGYCGDVLFPSVFLAQFLTIQVLQDQLASSAAARHDHFSALARRCFDSYPKALRHDFQILHAARESSGMNSTFRLWSSHWTPASGWDDTEVPIPTESVLVLAIGSGEETIRNHDAGWRRSAGARTSRGVFGAFCEALASRTNHHSGGPPQLVALYRKGPAEHLGVLHQGQRCLLGVPLPQREASTLHVEWRNDLFERCDPASMRPLPGAQKHARPPRS